MLKKKIKELRRKNSEILPRIDEIGLRVEELSQTTSCQQDATGPNICGDREKSEMGLSVAKGIDKEHSREVVKLWVNKICKINVEIAR